MLNEEADEEHTRMEHEILDLLFRSGLDSNFKKIKNPGDLFSDGLTTIARRKIREEPNMNSHKKQNELLIRETMMRESRRVREQELLGLLDGS